eukprot:6479481-Alexandrium_andersonii.AAC.1
MEHRGAQASSGTPGAGHPYQGHLQQRLTWAINNMSQAERSLRADLATPGSAVLLTAMPAEAALSLTDP